MNSYRVLLRRSGVRAAVALCIILVVVALGIFAIAAGRGSDVSNLAELESPTLVGVAGAVGFVLALQVLPGLASWLHVGITRNALLAYLLTLCAALALTAGGFLFLVALGLRARILSLGGGPVYLPSDALVTGIGLVATMALTATALWSLTQWARWPGFVAVFGFFVLFPSIWGAVVNAQSWPIGWVSCWLPLIAVIVLALRRLPS